MSTSTREVISAYKQGRLSIDELKAALRESRGATSRHPLSEGQKGMWALQKMFPSMTAYNIPLCFTVRDLQVDTLKRACRFLLEQYPVLGSAIREESGVPWRVQPSESRLRFEVAGLPDVLGSTASDEDIRAHVREKSKQPFSLEEGPLFRVYVLRLGGPKGGSGDTIVALSIHHIVFDGESLPLLVNTLFGAYRDLLKGVEPRRLALSETYEEFVEAEQELLRSEEGERRFAYWKSNLEGPLPVLALPTDRPRSRASGVFTGRSLSQQLGGDFGRRITSFAREQNISPTTFFLGALEVLLHRYSGESDIIVGMPVGVRGRDRFRGVLGFFINMVPIRSQLAGDESVAALLKRVQKTVINGMAMQYPFPALVRKLGLYGAGDMSPVFRVAFMYQDFLGQLADHGDGVAPFGEIRQEGEYELVVEVQERAGKAGAPEFTLCWKYNPELYDEVTVSRMMRQYTVLMEDVLAGPGREVDACSLVSEGERRTLLLDWNATRERYPSDRCVHDLFDEQAEKRPGAVALACGDEVLTYAELKRRSAALASYLRRSGVRENDLVAIYADRSVSMVVGMLAILKAGGAYVPLDPEYPEERLVAILKDCRAGVVVTQSALKRQATRLSGLARAADAAPATVVAMDSEEAARATGPADSASRSRPTDLAYVIYTSGTTGAPKGVMVPHRALTNFLTSMAKQPGLDEKDTLLAVTTYCFDIAALELFLPLTRGARCHLCDTRSAKDPELLKALIQRVRPTMMQATPSTWRLLFHAGWRNEESVKLLCGGEALPESVKEQLTRSGSEAWNLFGPTETTIWSTVARIEADKPITIGRPIANTQVHILDGRGRLAPIGVAGELCIAGDGVARGYFNKPAETAEKFIDNPFAQLAGNPPGKLYRTGDLARWRADGTIEYLGRLDFQVKIRGFRIEVQDVEHHLNSHPAVHTSAVVPRKQAGSEHLVAYYVPSERPREPGELAKALRAHLAAKLPDYMLPAFFIAVDAMPMTPNGKLDRKMLMGRKILMSELSDSGEGVKEAPQGGGPRPVRASRSTAHSRDTEDKLQGIWRGVLGIVDIGTTDGFFEAGGNSVSAVILAERVSAEFGVPLAASALFKYTNIQELARHLDERTRGAAREQGASALEPRAVAPPPGERAERVPVTGLPDYYRDCLAIIGISCRFPGASDHLAFWQNLKAGKESARFFSKEQLRAQKVPEALIENSHFVPMQLTIEGKDRFDRSFFNLTAKDAELMDPQFRLLLQHSWQAIEDAGYACKEIPDTGVYMAASNSYYQALLRSAGSIAETDEYQAWLFAQGGTIPTRISYELGLKGPSMFIHTNCSSGLTSLSVAARALLHGESKYALIGASTVFPQPSFGYVHQPGLNFSSDGHCRTFDAAADGLTTGEGVAVILVKRAVDAIQDGDHIYALLRGAAINNDGPDKAGFYAPSVRGQSAVIQRVLESTGVNPETIGYVEAHGTGTRLGDPIEVTAISDVYRQYTSKKQFCALGSVKPNIGHLDTVAGLSSCIKVALSLKYGEIPPSINYEAPNREIDFESSPFYVAQRLMPWPAPLTGAEGDSVRRAAVSSFGIGGTNAHAILESYPGAGPASKKGLGMERSDGHPTEFVVPLSAKNEERVRAYAERLLAALERGGESPPDIADLAFTLQVGRQAMGSRLAFVVKSVEELVEALRRCLRSASAPGECYSGQRDQKSDLVSFVEGDDDASDVVARWMQAGKLGKVAALWAKGVQVDWKVLYANGTPRRISLPTYPFAEERIVGAQEVRDGKAPAAPVVASHGMPEPLHPLVHENVSDAAHTQFKALFTGSEFFLRDHVVRGRKMLPGVAYLEMTRVAAERASGGVVVALQDVVWMKPVVVDDGPREVLVSLQDEAGGLRYEVSSGQAGAREVYSQGRLVMRPRQDAAAPATTDVARLREACTRRMSGDEFYKYMDRGGGSYGPRFRTIQELLRSDKEILARLELPPGENGEDSRFGLHPGIMDAAFQVSDSMLLEPGASGGRLPFFVKEVSIHQRTPSRGYVHAYLSNPGVSGGPVMRYDIRILDEEGRVCISFTEFTARIEATDAGPSRSTAPSAALVQAVSEPARGDGEGRLRVAREESPAKQVARAEAQDSKLSRAELTKGIVALLKSAVSEVIKADVDSLNENLELGEYGFDSLSLTTLSNRLNQTYALGSGRSGALNPTLFFEYPTLQRLAQYLADHHEGAFQQKLGRPKPPEAPAAVRSEAPPPPAAREEAPRLAQPPARSEEGIAPRPVRSHVPARQAGRLDDIAIVGMSGRFPAARNVDEFWRNLAEGRNCIREVPGDRWDWREYYGDPAKEVNKTDVKWGGFIDGLAEFDPLFFNISPREALQLDPSHRLVLMHIWLAIEDAGYNPFSLAGSKTALFVGVAQSGYSDLRRRSGQGVEGNSFLGVVPSIAVNRISHFLDLHGPSEPVETACSSSLVALHRAVTSIQCGDADLALVGGVQTILTPHAHIGFSKAGMLAKDGRCKTFSSNADGFVRGEGIGILFLKRLSQAEADGDAIYGVIKGSAVNHDGRSNTLTSPNPKAQRDVIVAAYERSGIDPRTVGYLETHGTGTRLGDPIEINALKGAFQQLYRTAAEGGDEGAPASRPSCALGAVKSNIGHLELAAGVSGVIKVLLQLKHQQLVRSLHCDELNPSIQLDGTPFHVQQQHSEWKSLVDAQGRRLPRRAGVSSFGIGGVNAHVVLEEYLGDSRARDAEAGQPEAVVLSAKDPERLKEYAEALLGFVRARRQSGEELRLDDLAYTLQVGREPMPERLGLIVSSLRELEEKLEALVAGKKDIKGLHRGRVKKDQDRASGQPAGEDVEKFVEIWVAKRKYSGLLDLWVKGTNLDWARLHGGAGGPRRIHLPGYPFAREHYWVPAAAPAPEPAALKPPERAAQLHPLLHERAPDSPGLRFHTQLTGEEFFLRDHRVNGSRVLPGVAYLEMACEAVRRAQGGQPSRGGVRITNVGWVRPMAVSGGVRVTIEQRPQAGGAMSFGIYTDGADGARVLQCEGVAELRSGDEAFVSSREILDLAALRKKFEGGIKANPLEWYDVFSRAGIEYGPTHRGMEQCFVGELGVLARLTLPSSARDTASQFTLHPSMLDSALQAALGIDWRGSGSRSGAGGPSLPFALESLEVLHGCCATMWAWVRPSRTMNGAADSAGAADGSGRRGVRKLDIDLCDEAGAVCVKLRGLSSRVLAQPQSATAAAAEAPPEPRSHGLFAADVGLLARTPVWNVMFPGRASAPPQLQPAGESRVVVLGGTDAEQRAIQQLYPRARLSTAAGDSVEALQRFLKEEPAIEHIVWIAPEAAASALDRAIDGDLILQGHEQGVLQLFRVIKALLAGGYGTRDLGWTVITRQTHAVSAADRSDPTHASVHGLVGSMAKEYPYWKVRLLDMEQGADWPFEAVFSMPYNEQGHALAWRNKDWYSAQLVPVHEVPATASRYKAGGVYVVVGGAGGIGAAWTQWMLEKYQARVVWLGRRKEDDAIRRKREALAKYGTMPVYVQADASDRKSLEEARQRIAELQWEGQSLKTSGLIDSALVLADASLATMDEQRFVSVLKAKVEVSVRLAEVFGRDPLDFMLFFSSITSFGKTAGQSNYAAGSVFQDAFARRLARDVSFLVKVVNWGYWGSVGVVSDTTYRERMAKAGFGSIEPEEGMQALEALLGSDFDQLAVVKTLKADALGKATPRSEWVRNYSQARGLGSPSRVVASVRELLARQAADWEKDAARVSVRSPELETLIARALLWGVTPHLRSREGLDSRFHRWLDETFDALAVRGFLVKDDAGGRQGGTYSVASGMAVDIEAVWREWREREATWSQDTSKRAPMRLAEACLRALPGILRGERRATEVMFPNSSMELVEGLYKGNRIVDAFNDIVHRTVLAYFESDAVRASARPVNLIEIGAGTGGTTAGLLPKLDLLRSRIGEYCYTDLSHAFLLHAREHYAVNRDFLKTQIFNVEKPLAEQGVAVDNYDLAIATNVLHATRNIRQTLRNAKAALRAGGLLILNELSHKTLFSHVTFGLLEGWWLYEDDAIRIPGSPGLYPDAWKRVLEEEGYVSIFFPAQGLHHLGQQVIVAQSNGVVRQRGTARPVAVAEEAQKAPAAPAAPEQVRPARVEPAPEPVKVAMAPSPAPKVAAVPVDAGSGGLTEHAHEYLMSKLSDVLKVPREKIEVDASFASYGTDSIMALALIRELEKDFGSLPKTLFFEFENIVELGEYLLDNHAEALQKTRGPREDMGPRSDVGAVSDVGAGSEDLTGRVHQYLMSKLSDVLKVPREKIEVDASFASYGTDSIMALALIRELEKDFGSLPKTLFFEFENIVELGEYLLDNHAETLRKGVLSHQAEAA